MSREYPARSLVSAFATDQERFSSHKTSSRVSTGKASVRAYYRMFTAIIVSMVTFVSALMARALDAASLNYAYIGYNVRNTRHSPWIVPYTPDPPPFVTHRGVTCQKCLLISVMSNA